MNNVKLCICIPTYNRSKFLEVCLKHLIPQVKNNKNVEVIVIDNASTDNTERFMNTIISEHNNIHYYKNERNLGYSGNQVKCFEYSSGQYTAILSDDDVYTNNLVDDLLNIVNKREYSFIALNYFSFLESIDKPRKSNFAPLNDVTFSRAYDIMNYPSVGHFSGFVFNSDLSKKILSEIIANYSIEYFEMHRGVITDIAHRSLSWTELPSYFLGVRKLATRMPKEIDYDSLNHLCLDYYMYFQKLNDEGIINAKDLLYRKKLVLNRLPRAIISDSYRKNPNELAMIVIKLNRLFKKDKYFQYIVLPILFLSKYYIIQSIFKYLHRLIRHFKYSSAR